MKYLNDYVLSADILALHIYDNLLLIGEGSYISVYDLNNNELLLCSKLFVGSSIHGIKRCSAFTDEKKEKKFLIYGQKNFALVSLGVFNSNGLVLRKSKEYYVDDWIVDVICSEIFSIIIVTAHNSVIHISISSLLTELKEFIDKPFSLTSNQINSNYIIDIKYCSENSLLYCGQIYGRSLASCIVLSGTAFGKIHIWAPWTLSSNLGRNEPITSISGIKGAVFSVCFNEHNNLIGATSDDRSVRIWKVYFSTTENSIISATCTEKDVDWQSRWSRCSITEVFCSFGHSARVWRSEILDDETVISCGEDSTICYWSSSGVLLTSWVAHPSSSVWSLCYNAGNIFTGGGDGAIKKWNLTLNKKENLKCFLFPKAEDIKSSNINSELCNQINQKRLISKKFDNETHLRAINLIDFNTCTVVTNDGSFWVFKESEKTWNHIFHHAILRGYIITSVNNESSLLALGTLLGFIIVFDTESWKCLHQQLISSNKIQSLFFIGKNQLISCTSSGKVQLWTVSSEESSCLTMEREHSLPSCRQHWVTSAALFNEKKYLIVGDPCGNVYLYSQNEKAPKSELKGLHGRNGVTSIKACKSFLLSTGRDGFIRYLAASDGQLSVLCEFKVSFGNWICGIFKIGSDAVVPIFSGEKLKIWNISTKSLISEVKCGGGHRSWDILIGPKRFSSSGVIEEFECDKNDTKVAYAFLKDGSPFIWNFDRSHKLFHSIKDSHGREIQCLEPLFHSGTNILYVFGGEDTLLHTHILLKQNMWNVNETKSHLSSIRSITKIEPLNGKQVGNNQIQFITCGGRAQMKIWSAELTDEGVDFINLQDKEKGNGKQSFYDFFNPIIFCKEIATHMLTPESDRSWKSVMPAFAPETRYMDCLASWISEHTALIILASSDGFVRFFRFTDGEFNLFYMENCHYCVLRLYLLKTKSCSYVIATTTRGALLIWNYENFKDYLLETITTTTTGSDIENGSKDMFNTCFLVQVQGSGLNSIAGNCELKEESYLATGGDDGAIHLLKAFNTHDETNRLQLTVDVCSNVYRHSAQVSGLTWLDESRLCSASIDQRVIVWQLEQEKLIPLSVHFSSVPNIQGMKLSSSNEEEKGGDHNSVISKRLFVYGSGIQVFEVGTVLKS